MPYLTGYGNLSQAEYDNIVGATKAADTGTDAPIRTTEQTQSVPAKTLSSNTAATNDPTANGAFVQQADGTYIAAEDIPPPDAGGNSGPSAPGQPGAAAPPEDSGSTTSQGFQAETTINTNSSTSSTTTVPRNNVLDQYASYTYSLSWYMLSAAQYTAMQQSHKLNTNQWSLLVQSGGAAVQKTGVSNTPNTATTGRNKYFNLDYYLDNFMVKAMSQKQATNSLELEFDVTEPNGMTLLSNLNSAANDIEGKIGSLTTNTQYVMVIRFYGYDAQGNLVTKVGENTGTPGATTTNSNAVVVKYFPFTITEFTFASENKAVIYHIKGQPQTYTYASGSALGSIPFAVELVGETVADVLNGPATLDATPPEDGRVTTAAPAPLHTNAFVEATGVDYGLVSS